VNRHRAVATGLLIAVALQAEPFSTSQVTPGSAMQALADYERGSIAGIGQLDPRTLIAELDRAASAWIAAVPEPQRDHRRALLTMLPLEVALARDQIDAVNASRGSAIMTA
jgi:hypothetical protein